MKRCLDAGYRDVALVCDPTMKRGSIESRFVAAYGRRSEVPFSTIRQFCRRLEERAREVAKAPPPEGGEPYKAMPVSGSVDLSETERETIMQEQLREIRKRILRAKGGK
ncbi:MAG: hypothetical protein KIT22_04060 [Verrucomicrobiae bacterium]|nr:hypothetical protein [Verrucomicrobiae bacterium]